MNSVILATFNAYIYFGNKFYPGVRFLTCVEVVNNALPTDNSKKKNEILNLCKSLCYQLPQ